MWETHEVETDDGVIDTYHVVPDEEILASRYAKIEQENRMAIRNEVRDRREYDKASRELAKIIDEMEEGHERTRDLFIRSVKITVGIALVYSGMIGGF